MSDMAARIASAVGDPSALLALAIELNASLSVATSELAALESIRTHAREKKRRQRKAGSVPVSRDVPGLTGTGGDNPPTPSPQVSPSFPTPLITPSFPPSPLPPQAPQGNDEERRLYDRAPEAWPVIVQFLAGKEAPARLAWIGRFHGALDRPPHPTGAELRDAIGDLMTLPPEDWKPTLFRRYVERIRRDAERDVERGAARATAAVQRANGVPSARDQATVEAGNLVAQIRELIFEQPIPGQGARRLLRNADVERIDADVNRAYRTVGGASRFLAIDAKPDDLPFLINNFAAALHDARANHSEAKSA